MGVSVGKRSQSGLCLEGGTSCFARLPSLLSHSNGVVAGCCFFTLGGFEAEEFISLGLPNFCPGRQPAGSKARLLVD